jgi:hypothetical protein
MYFLCTFLFVGSCIVLRAERNLSLPGRARDELPPGRSPGGGSRTLLASIGIVVR